MRIRFSNEVMTDEKTWRLLDRMVMHFEDERHEWLADNPAEIEASRWMHDGGRSGETNKKAYQEHVRWAAYPKKRMEVTVVLETVSETRLSTPDALRAMETPLYIALENATADGGFLVTVILALNRTELWEAWEKRWLALDQMGGYGEAAKTIARLREHIPGPCRIFILADSDARYPKEPTATIKKVSESCHATGASFAVLRKRKIENYLPEAVLDRINKVTYRAYKKLSWEQRDHYEMKCGFKSDDDGNVSVPTEQAGLYSGVDYHTIRGLLGGFGSDISICFVKFRESIKEADIRQVCDSDPTELDRIFDRIEELL